jgi:hypothetical protein
MGIENPFKNWGKKNPETPDNSGNNNIRNVLISFASSAAVLACGGAIYYNLPVYTFDDSGLSLPANAYDGEVFITYKDKTYTIGYEANTREGAELAAKEATDNFIRENHIMLIKPSDVVAKATVKRVYRFHFGKWKF